MNNFQFKIFNFQKKGGFTLVELIVATSVFVIATTIAVGAFVGSLRTQRAVNHILAVNSNTSLVVEQMAREIRTGYDFGLNNVAGGNCSSGQSEELEFTNSRSNTVLYRKEGDAIARKECSGVNCGGADFLSMTASNVLMERLCFSNTGNPNNNKDPWRITLFLRVGGTEAAGERLNLQTTLSARILPRDLQ